MASVASSHSTSPAALNLLTPDVIRAIARQTAQTTPAPPADLCQFDLPAEGPEDRRRQDFETGPPSFVSQEALPQSCSSGRDVQLSNRTVESPGSSISPPPPPLVRCPWLAETADLAEDWDGISRPPSPAARGDTPRLANGTSVNANSAVRPQPPVRHTPEAGLARRTSKGSVRQQTTKAGPLQTQQVHRTHRPQRQSRADPVGAASASAAAAAAVKRLQHAGAEYDHKRVEKQRELETREQELVARARPVINPRSAAMAKGIEPLHERYERLVTHRAKNMENVRQATAERATRDHTGRPEICQRSQALTRGVGALQRWEEKRREKALLEERRREEESQQECTFRPQLCAGTERLTRRSALSSGASRRSNPDGARTPPAYERMHLEGCQRQLARGRGADSESTDGHGFSVVSASSSVSVASAASVKGQSPTLWSPDSASASTASASIAVRQPASSAPVSFEQFMSSLSTHGSSSVRSSTPQSSRPEVVEHAAVAELQDSLGEEKSRAMPFDFFRKQVDVSNLVRAPSFGAGEVASSGFADDVPMEDAYYYDDPPAACRFHSADAPRQHEVSRSVSMPPSAWSSTSSVSILPPECSAAQRETPRPSAREAQRGLASCRPTSAASSGRPTARDSSSGRTRRMSTAKSGTTIVEYNVAFDDIFQTVRGC